MCDNLFDILERSTFSFTIIAGFTNEKFKIKNYLHCIDADGYYFDD